ncbi:MAG: hypothetical protein ABI220_05035 [Candidatus Saccharimonadales bacterium]
MREIVWVFGVSASGKETFMKSLIQSPQLARQFGWDGRKIVICKESLVNLGSLDESRTSIINEVSALFGTNDVVLIKWQYGDSLLQTPQKLQEMFPNAKHSIIVMNVNDTEQVKRLRTKPWWHDMGSEIEFIASENKLVNQSVAELATTFTVIHLNASKGYTPISTQ